MPIVRIATIAGIAASFTLLAEAAEAQFQPDLVARLRPEFSSVAVGADLRFIGQLLNVGGLPCNRLSVTTTFPPQVTPIGAFSNVSAVVCTLGSRASDGSTPITCGAGTNFLFGPGPSVGIYYWVRGTAPGTGLTATAVVDPARVCTESNEGNNAVTSAPFSVVGVPTLKMELNKPFPTVTPGGRNVRSTQIFPVTITNIGSAAAEGMTFTVKQPFIVAPDVYRGPTIDVAYPGGRLAEGVRPAAQLPPQCSQSVADNVLTFTCSLQTRPRTGEQVQVHFRGSPCNLVTPIAQPDVTVSTARDTTEAFHTVNLRQACYY